MHRFAIFWAALVGGAVSVAGELAGESVLTVYQSAPGQFEVIGDNPTGVGQVTQMAREFWTSSANVLGLPARFPQPITLRLSETDANAGDFAVIVEPGAKVSARLGWSATMAADPVRRVVVDAALRRQAQAWGAEGREVVPAWLVAGVAGVWRVRSRPAWGDLWRDRALAAPMPLMETVLATDDEAPLGGERAQAAMWLLLAWRQLAGEAGWLKDLRALLLGDSSIEVLRRRLGDQWPRRERWWQEAAMRVAMPGGAPGLGILESQRWLATEAAWPDARDGTPTTLDNLLERVPTPEFRAELAARSERLAVGLPAVHPFFYNAALSLGGFYASLQRDDVTDAKRRLGELETDLIMGARLTRRTRELLRASEY